MGDTEATSVSEKDAQKEFDLIADLLLVPEDRGPQLPVRRQWKNECVGLPDLVVVNRGDLCRRNDAGDLMVTVRNQGSISAFSTVTRVVYDQGEREVATPGLAPGQEDTVIVDFVRTSGDSDGSLTNFQIILDAKNELLEFNKENNTAQGLCIDP